MTATIGSKPRRWGSFYVAEHRLYAMRSYLQTLLVTGFGNPLLYLFGLGVGLARLVNVPVGGATYLEFVAPALLASAAVTVAGEEFSYPVLMGFKWNPIFFGMNAAPISGLQIVNGMIISIFVRMFPTVAVYYGFMLIFGAVPRVSGVFDIFVAVLVGMSVGILIMAYTSTITEDHGQMAIIQRFILMPMFLFSGTFFPITNLPIYLRWIGWISPLWHGTQLGRVLSYGLVEPGWLTVVHVAYLLVLAALGWFLAARQFPEEAELVTATVPTSPALVTAQSRSRFLGAIYAGNSRAVLGRGLLATRTSNYWVVLSGFFEPVLYLLSLGIGLGSLIGTVTTSTGQHVPYAAYIAPALLAVSAMNGAIYDSTWNVFFKMNYGKLYEGMLATSIGPFDVALGEIAFALLRGLLYAAGFMVVMQIFGLNLAWTAILALPAVVLIAFGFASLGMAITSYMKTFQQMDWINFVMLPMFIFSATFYPVTVYPPVMQYIIEALPLWHGVELIRGLTTGALSWGLLWHVLYFAVMITVGLIFTTKRLRALFLA